MLTRMLSWFFLVAGLGLLGLGAYYYWAPAADSSLEVFECEKEIADSVPGRKTTVVYHFHNHSSQPLRVLGLAGC